MNIFIDPDAYHGEILKTNSFSYHLKESERPKLCFRIKNNEYESTNVLGTSDSWKTQSRGTDGKWHSPAKLKTFQLAVTYEKGVLRSYINGLVDQYIPVKGLSLSDITIGGHKGSLNDFRVFDRALSQNEIKAVHRDVIPAEEDMAGYLMVYFKDDTHGLYFALSNDGYSFTDVNNGKPVIAGDTIAEQKGIRDPYIMRGLDGYFYMAMTDLHIYAKKAGYRDTDWERDSKEYGWGNNKGFVLMRSRPDKLVAHSASYRQGFFRVGEYR